MPDYRRDHRRQQPSDRRGSLCYMTRRDWLLAEFIIGFVSCAVAVSGISGGLVADALRASGSNVAWFMGFEATGMGMIVVASIETMCRRHHECPDYLLRRYAYLRMLLHLGNAMCWLSAFVWLTLSQTFVASILYESIPLLIINLQGATEHAKALWLKPRQAGTTSVVCAVYRRLSRG